tara:strand:- start:1 stop:198 length:198 start_codon:yes stop_codon:yes gene_type:complete
MSFAVSTVWLEIAQIRVLFNSLFQLPIYFVEDKHIKKILRVIGPEDNFKFRYSCARVATLVTMTS